MDILVIQQYTGMVEVMAVGEICIRVCTPRMHSPYNIIIILERKYINPPVAALWAFIATI